MSSYPRCGDAHQAYQRLVSVPSGLKLPLPRVNTKHRLGPMVPVSSSSDAQSSVVVVGDIPPLDLAEPQIVGEMFWAISDLNAGLRVRVLSAVFDQTFDATYREQLIQVICSISGLIVGHQKENFMLRGSHYKSYSFLCFC